MKPFTRSILLLLMVTTSLTHGGVFTAQQENDLVNFVENLRQCRGIVGLTIAVVKGNDTWTRGFGMMDRETGRNVTSSHLFGIGSVTKSFTSALLSLCLNDTASDSWKTPVVDILGKEFEFVNDQLTRQVTLRDLLSHRTGLKSADLPLMVGSNLTMAKSAECIRHLPAQNQFRDEFNYNNWMYPLAGHVTEVMGGAPWEDLLHAGLLQPLNMSSTRILGKTVTVLDDNVAKPYVQLGEEVVLSSPDLYKITPHEPAGAIASSADDMAQWLLLFTNEGRSQAGVQVLSNLHFREMTRAHMSLSQGFRDYFSLLKPQYPVSFLTEGYGYGWMTASYRGYPVTWHSGGFFAYTTYLAFLPHLDAGFFVSNNGPGESGNHSVINNLIFYHVADLLLQEKPWVNISNACQFPEPWVNKPSEDGATNHTVYDNLTFDKPEYYEGRYGHPLFGDVNVVRNGSHALTVGYGHLEGMLFRGEEQHVAMWEVQGKLAFYFLHGNKKSYLQLKFSGPSSEGLFENITLTMPGEELEFVRVKV